MLNDRDVRQALHWQVLQEHRREGDTLVLHELGLRHGTCRVDIAVVNGFLHGFEIKSDADTLDRLDQQAHIYSQVFDRVTLIVGEKHGGKAIDIIPAWWGVKIAAARDGKIEFRHERPFRNNPKVDPIAVAELLWRPEVVTILRALGVPEKQLKLPRAKLYALLAESVDLSELRRLARVTLKARTTWRGQRPPSSDGD